MGRCSALVWSLASFFSAYAPGMHSFLAARLLLGVGEAPTFPANSKAIGYWFPLRERSLATSCFHAAAKFASAIGVPLLGIIAIHWGWRSTFSFTGGLSFLFFLAFWFVYRNPSKDRSLDPEELRFIRQGHAQPEGATRQDTGAPLGYLLCNRRVLGATLGFAAYNWTFYLLLTWLPAYLSERLHMNLLHSVLYTSLPWGIATATDLGIGGWLVDHLIPARPHAVAGAADRAGAGHGVRPVHLRRGRGPHPGPGAVMDQPFAGRAGRHGTGGLVHPLAHRPA